MLTITNGASCAAAGCASDEDATLAGGGFLADGTTVDGSPSTSSQLMSCQLSGSASCTRLSVLSSMLHGALLFARRSLAIDVIAVRRLHALVYRAPTSSVYEVDSSVPFQRLREWVLHQCETRTKCPKESMHCSSVETTKCRSALFPSVKIASPKEVLVSYIPRGFAHASLPNGPSLPHIFDKGTPTQKRSGFST